MNELSYRGSSLALNCWAGLSECRLGLLLFYIHINLNDKFPSQKNLRLPSPRSIKFPGVLWVCGRCDRFSISTKPKKSSGEIYNNKKWKEKVIAHLAGCYNNKEIITFPKTWWHSVMYAMFTAKRKCEWRQAKSQLRRRKVYWLLIVPRSLIVYACALLSADTDHGWCVRRQMLTVAPMPLDIIIWMMDVLWMQCMQDRIAISNIVSFFHVKCWGRE